MNYKKNSLYVENISIQRIAKKFGTPSYCYSLNKLKLNIKNFKKYFRSINPLLCFSVKSNSNLQILKEINKMGMGADVVSKGELIMALKSGISPKKIVFSGVGKTFDELKFAIDKNILLINSESESEINQIKKISKIKRKKIDIGVRLNPNIDSGTLKKISTGKKEDKFGLTEIDFLKAINKFKNSKYLNIRCLSVHIGSQITNHKPYAKMLKVIGSIIKKSNHNFDFVDLGGGMGISYSKKEKQLNLKQYAQLVNKFIKNKNSKIIFEPGRFIIGNTAILITKIIYIKKSNNKNFIVLDAGMNNLMRPALYDAQHQIIPLKKTNKLFRGNLEFVGPVCESSDKFSNQKSFSQIKEGDYVGLVNVGAYGMSLSSNYNTRPTIAEIMVNGSKHRVIRKRQSLENLVNN